MFVKMPNPNPAFESSALAHITAVVHLILIVLRLATEVLEKSVQILDLVMQPATSTSFPTNLGTEEVGAQGPDATDANQSESLSVDTTVPNSDISASIDPSPTVEARDGTTCQCIRYPPVPIFCDPSTRSRRFYAVTVGHQVGIFDNR
jgi:hypothetical protein